MQDQLLTKLKHELFSDIKYRLGDGIIDLEADIEHLEAAYKYALKTYRQRAQRATEETYTLMTMQEGVSVYTLPTQFINVRRIFRRTVGMETGPASSSYDPFSSAMMNTYLLNYNQAGGLATYELYSQYVELSARMFGGHIIFTFNPVTKELRLVRNPKGTGEQILIWGDMEKTETVLLQDNGSAVWIADWTLSEIKRIIGEGREKFSSIAGPSSGTTLNGAQMKADAKEMQERLLKELRTYVDHSMPISFIIG